VGFIRNEGIERFAETVLAEDADSERGGVVAGVGRPTDKLFKIVEIGSLDVGGGWDYNRFRGGEK
jgi:hypothetical protein